MDATIDAKPGVHALLAFAAKADDLDEIKKSVNDAASASGALWLSYLFVLLYTAVSAGGVTSTDLFMENSVKLPFLSTDLPLKAFFLLAPALFLITHVYTLMSFVILSDRAKWYHRELRRQIAAADAGDAARAHEMQDDLRRQLVSNIFVQFLAGPSDLRQGAFGFVLKLIVWTTLVCAPIALLLEVQVQFLPFHDKLITWTHRVVLLLDVVAVWWLGYRIMAGRFSEAETWHRWAARSAQGAVIVASILALFFSFELATFDNDGTGKTALLHAYLFRGDIDPKSRLRKSYFSDTLVLSGFNIYDKLKIDDLARLASQRAIFSARSRDFRGAVFDLSDLSQVDFEGADLSNASFDLATVRMASFYCAKMSKTNFTRAHIEAAWFHAADLSGADLSAVNGQAARFEAATLTYAEMKGALLQATTFDGADLTNADLESARLRGASLASPMLEKGCENAKPPKPPSTIAVVLKGTNLADADLGEAMLRDADLTEVGSMKSAKLSNADLTGATVADEKLSDIDWGAIERGINVDKLKWDGETTARSVATGSARAIPVDSPRRKLLAHAADGSAYSSRLVAGLLDLVCTGVLDSPFIARGLVLNQRIATAGESTPVLVKAMVEGSCATTLDLPSGMKADLVALKRAALHREAR